LVGKVILNGHSSVKEFSAARLVLFRVSCGAIAFGAAPPTNGFSELMRILFLAHRLPYPPDKGDRIRCFWDLKTLAMRHEIDLFCFCDSAAEKAHIEGLRRYCRRTYVEKLRWFTSRRRAVIAIAKGGPFTVGYYYSDSMAKAIAHALSSTEYDAIFVYSSSMAQYVAEQVSVPVVMDMVDADSDKWEQFADYSTLPASWLWHKESERLSAYERGLVRRFAATLACTPVEETKLRKITPNAGIQVLMHPVDTAFFDPASVAVSPEIRAWQPYLIFTGSMDYLPNVDAVRYFYGNVLPVIRETIPEIHFVIAGRNPVRSVRRLSDDPSVWVTGSVSDVRPLLRGAAAAVAPLRIVCGVQNKILEALAMGLAVATHHKVAQTLPAELAALLIVEDEPAVLGRRIVEALSTNGEPYRRSVRQKLTAYFHDTFAEGALETVLTRAATAQKDFIHSPAAQGVLVNRKTVI